MATSRPVSLAAEIYGRSIPDRLEDPLRLGAGGDVEGPVTHADGRDEAGVVDVEAAVSRVLSRFWVNGLQGLMLDFALGAIDAQVITAKELRIETLIAEVKQALAGERVLAKSYGVLAEAFTLPALGATGTVRFRDFEHLPGFRVAADGDTVQLPVIDFTYNEGEGLLVAEMWGRVTDYVDLGDGTQSWTWTTLDVGLAGAGYVVPAELLALDWGTPGQGLIDETVIDPVASPRRRVFRWYSDAGTGLPDRIEVVEQQGSLADLDPEGLDLDEYGTFTRAIYGYQDEDNYFAADSNGLAFKSVGGVFDVRAGDGRVYVSGGNLKFQVGGADLGARLSGIDSQFDALPETFAALADLDAYALLSALDPLVTGDELAAALGGYVTDGELGTALGGYVTGGQLTTALGAYLLSSTFNALLADLGDIPPGGFAGILATADEDRATAALLAGYAAADVERTGAGAPILDGYGHPVTKYERQTPSASLVLNGQGEAQLRDEDERGTDGQPITDPYGGGIEGYLWNTGNGKNPLVRDAETGYAVPIVASFSAAGVVAQATADFAKVDLLAGYTFTDADGNTGQTLAGITAFANRLGAYAALVTDAFGNVASVELASGEAGSAIRLTADQIVFDGDSTFTGAVDVRGAFTAGDLSILEDGVLRYTGAGRSLAIRGGAPTAGSASPLTRQSGASVARSEDGGTVTAASVWKGAVTGPRTVTVTYRVVEDANGSASITVNGSTTTRTTSGTYTKQNATSGDVTIGLSAQGTQGGGAFPSFPCQIEVLSVVEAGAPSNEFTLAPTGLFGEDDSGHRMGIDLGLGATYQRYLRMWDPTGTKYVQVVWDFVNHRLAAQERQTADASDPDTYTDLGSYVIS